MTRDQAIALMIRLEGGESNVVGDPGGHTKYGITQATLDLPGLRSFPLVLPHSVSDLTSIEAEYIYRVVDWDVIQGDKLPAPLAALMLNSAVNQGEPTAVGLLQECVRVPVDHVMGPATLAAVAAWKSPYMPEQTLAEEFAAHVAVRYAALSASEGQFELGWMRRLLRVYTLAIGG